MNRLLILLISFGILVSCATTSPNPWEGLDTSVSPAAAPIDCGGFPVPTETIGDSLVYDNAGGNALNDYRKCSEANEGIAGEHAAQIGQLKIARKALVEAGQSQRNIAEMRQTMLADERRHHLFQSAGYWVLILGAVAL